MTHEDELARLERTRASLPRRPEPKLDTASPPPISWGEIIDERIAAERKRERKRAFDLLAETLALERKDTDDALERLEARIAVLEAELKQRSGDGVVDLRYRRHHDAA